MTAPPIKLKNSQRTNEPSWSYTQNRTLTLSAPIISQSRKYTELPIIVNFCLLHLIYVCVCM